MPIRFRCGYCSRLLGIARRKAGTNTTCPHCNAIIAVPALDEFAADDPRPELAEIDKLLQADRGSGPVAARSLAFAAPAPNEGFSTTPSAPPDAATPAPTAVLTSKPAASKPAPPRPQVLSLTDAEKPLLERDVDAVLGSKSATPEPARKPQPVATSGGDALSLDDEPVGYWVSPQKMTILVAAGVVSLILAFVAGYFVGAR